MKKYFCPDFVFFIMISFFLFSLIGKAEPNARTEVGIFYEKQKLTSAANAKKFDQTVNTIKETGLKTRLITSAVFKENAAKAPGVYKRIYISLFSNLFTPEEYKWLAEYVKNGGLLICASPLSATDLNADGIYDKAERAKDRARRKNGDWPVHGIQAHSTVSLKTIKVISVCPLTQGFAQGVFPVKKGFMRNTRNGNATVVAEAEAVSRNNRKLNNAVLVSYRKLGKGACIYIAASPFSSGVEGVKLFKNCFSAQVFEWLVYEDD
ncbi:MAG: hypothetical protein WC082_15880 [Victivallales bacterium]